MNSKLPHYLVIGGGLSGLTSAYLLSLAKPLGSYRLTVLEQANRWGGWIQSNRNTPTGAIYELGPHTGRATGPTSSLILRMIMNLNLQDSLLWIRRDSKASQQFIYAKGKLSKISLSSPFFSEPFTRSHLSVILKRLLSHRPPYQSDWTIDEFFRTRFDSEFADYIGNAMVRGIYAGDSKCLSVRACLPRLIEMEQNGPNLILGSILSMLSTSRSTNESNLPKSIDSFLPKLNNLIPPKAFAWSLKNGMESLIDKLVNHLESQNTFIGLEKNVKIKSISPKLNYFEVVWENDHSVVKIEQIDKIILCCPSYNLKSLMTNVLSPKTIDRLNLPWANVVSVSLEIENNFQSNIKGFGHLVPSIEDPYILGVIYDSIGFPQLDGDKRYSRYTVMMKPLPEWLQNSANFMESNVEKIACDVLKKHLNIDQPQVIHKQISLHRNCIPQYPLNHIENLAKLREELNSSLENLSIPNSICFVGYSYDGVGLGDVVCSAAKAVDRLIQT